MGDGSIRILMIEDDPADAELVASALVRAGTDVRVTGAATREAVVLSLRDYPPDVVLCDHGIPHLDTRAALDLVREARPTVPFIIVTGMLDDRLAVECLRAGAEDVVRKDGLARLAEVIRAALAVRIPLQNLTPRQLEVLRLVALGHTTPAIARLLALSAKTVDTHRTAAMKRLDIHDVAGLVRYAVRVGLVTAGR